MNDTSPLILALATFSAVIQAGSKKTLVKNAKKINNIINIKKLTRPGNATKNPAPKPATVVTVVSKIVCPVLSIERLIPLSLIHI